MFWVMVLLGPFFFLAILIVPIGLSMDKQESNQILYLDKTEELEPYLYSDKNIDFIHTSGTLEEAIQEAKELHYDGVVLLTKTENFWTCRYYKIGLFGLKNPEMLKMTLQQRVATYELTEKRDVVLPPLSFYMDSISTGSEEDSIGFVAGLFVAMLILVFVNQYSQMVLRGIVEEKQNRISELILTSVKPVYFIIGKIAGIASVAFLQMLIWFGSTGLLSLTVYKYFKLERFSNAQLASTLRDTADMGQSIEMNSLLNALSSVNYAGLLGGFLFYFIFGYLLFSALFAIIGIVAGNDSDAHQLAMPIALPLAIPLILLQSIVDHPDSNLAYFLSIFPFTSPTTMMIRLPFGVPTSQVLLSATVLVGTFFLVAYSAAKVYRVGVLMYGKKPNVREVWKWVRSS
jgi:ABC-2 type transport system permease protein